MSPMTHKETSCQKSSLITFQKCSFCKAIQNLKKIIIFVQLTIIGSTYKNQMHPLGSQSSMKSNLDVNLLSDTLSARASYSSVKDGFLPIKPIQIFTKTGTTGKYREYVAETAKKTAYPAKMRKNIAKKRKNESDDDYNVKNQKKDRNVTSNLIHHLIKFLNATFGQEELARKIIDSHKLKTTYEEYYSQLQAIAKNLKTYVTLKHIEQLWFSEDPLKYEFCLIMRIISKIFYKKNGFSSVFYSNKFNVASKSVHYKGIRNLVEVLVRKDLEKLKNSLIYQ